MNYFIMFLCLILVSCASKEKKYKELEDKLDKLTKLMEKQAPVAVPEKQEKDEDFNETTSMPIALPQVSEKVDIRPEKGLLLGKKNGRSFEFFFEQKTYWVKVSPPGDVSAEIELRVHGKDHENPETISFVQIDDQTFQGSGEVRTGKTTFELHYRPTGKESVIINFDITFRE